MKKYQKPNFPAQDAWKNMQEILDKEMPVEENRKKRLGFFWIAALLLLSSGIYLFDNSDKLAVNKNSSSKNENISPIKLTTKAGKSDANIEANINSKQFASSEQNIVLDNQTNTNKLSFTKSIAATENTIPNNKVRLTKSRIINAKKTNANVDDDYTISTPEINVLKKFIEKKNGVISNNNSSYTVVNSTVIDNNKKDELESTLENNASTKVVENIAKTTIATTVVKVPKTKLQNTIHYGLQWNVLLPEANNYLDYNAKSQPLSIAIPEFWVSKDLSAKSEIGLQVNPYSQYTLRSNNVLTSKDYVVSVSQGSNQNQITTTYLQTRTLLKAMGVELTAKYTYKINNNFSVAVGVGTTLLNAAVVNDRVISANGKLAHDSIYGIAQGYSDWNYLKSSFVVGRLEMLYQLNKMQVGLAFVKPLSNLYSFSNTNENPVNARLVLRCRIK